MLQHVTLFCHWWLVMENVNYKNSFYVTYLLVISHAISICKFQHVHDWRFHWLYTAAPHIAAYCDNARRSAAAHPMWTQLYASTLYASSAWRNFTSAINFESSAMGGTHRQKRSRSTWSCSSISGLVRGCTWWEADISDSKHMLLHLPPYLLQVHTAA